MNAKFPQINNVVRRGTQMVPKLQRLLMGIVVSVGTVALVATAAAHDVRTSAYQGRGYGRIKENHTFLMACDVSADGWGVGIYAQSNVNKEYHVPDGNGSRDGCGEGRLDPGEFVINARICTAGPDNVQHCNVMNP